ncbi:hypothetical protein CBL_10011 [Carabus blaptoides fortunei]
MKRNTKPRTRVSPSSLTLESPGAPDDNTVTSTGREPSRVGMTRKIKTPDPHLPSSAPWAAPPRLCLTKSKDRAKLNPGPRLVSTLGTLGIDPTPFNCKQCGKQYKPKSSLARHAKECGLSDCRKGLHCKVPFPKYQAVGQHERRVHPVEYRKTFEESLPAPESVLMTQIAKIEVASKAGVPKLKEMEQVTWLIAHMFAIKERKEQASKIFQLREPSSVLKATPSTSTASTSRPNIPSIPSPTCIFPSPAQRVSLMPSVVTSRITVTPDGNLLTTTTKRKASTSPDAAIHLKTYNPSRCRC